MDVTTKTHNLNSAILFMQQEHANTLKGLHQEISSLQQKCSEMTFQVAMSNTYTSQEDVYREKCEALEKDVTDQKKANTTLEETLRQKDKRVRLLEQQLKAHQQKIADTKRQEKQQLLEFNKQLDQKAETIAYLTQEILELRKKLVKSQRVAKDQVSSSHESPRQVEAAVEKENHRQSVRRRSIESPNMLVPAPPPKSAPRHRPAGLRRLPDKPRTPENIPDPTPFLHQPEMRNSRLSMEKKERSVLPPINSFTNKVHCPGIVPPQKTNSFTFIKKGTQNVETISGSVTDVEIGTLAMGNVTRRDQGVRRAQEYSNMD